MNDVFGFGLVWFVAEVKDSKRPRGGCVHAYAGEFAAAKIGLGADEGAPREVGGVVVHNTGGSTRIRQPHALAVAR